MQPKCTHPLKIWSVKGRRWPTCLVYSSEQNCIVDLGMQWGDGWMMDTADAQLCGREKALSAVARGGDLQPWPHTFHGVD